MTISAKPGDLLAYTCINTTTDAIACLPASGGGSQIGIASVVVGTARRVYTITLTDRAQLPSPAEDISAFIGCAPGIGTFRQLAIEEVSAGVIRVNVCDAAGALADGAGLLHFSVRRGASYT